jgi:hypothetical protein
LNWERREKEMKLGIEKGKKIRMVHGPISLRAAHLFFPTRAAHFWLSRD